ncbi:MAG: NAD-specific glutamate dehydrogenase [Candidatus Xenolissoclinum pacificiensis L6]|uniref:NAD-specific glutamate dehydrogenase n=1 Tax=Candidatus Xenolissoclinum pacificiensis L6 TaxID=1401685 RepID=W2V112_9RICK|nr:MAG: NAD-specific glutamate dehydrogenase [Candidatus Xenolissoclinum pacificiensis L6]
MNDFPYPAKKVDADNSSQTCLDPTIFNMLKQKKYDEKFKQFVASFYISYSNKKFYNIKVLHDVSTVLYEFIQRKDTENIQLKIDHLTTDIDGKRFSYTILASLNDDSPFLVDSLTNVVKSNDFVVIQQRINAILQVTRDQNNHITNVYSIQDNQDTKNNSRESLICFIIPHISEQEIQRLRTEITHVLCLTKKAYQDWNPMLSELQNSCNALTKCIKNSSCEDLEEQKSFLEWLQKNSFVFLGYEQYTYKQDKVYLEKSLGISTISPTTYEEGIVFKYSGMVHIMELKEVSKVHRSSNMDCIRVKILDKKCQVIGERLFIGLFTSIVYYQSVYMIPIIRKKVQYIEEQTCFLKGGHNNKFIVNLLQELPRADLLYISSDELLDTCRGMLSLSVKPRLKIFIYKDMTGSFIRCIIYVPTDTFTMEMWPLIQKKVSEVLDAVIDSANILLGNTELVRMRIVVKIHTQSNADHPVLENDYLSGIVVKLEEALYIIVSSWYDSLREIIIDYSSGTTVNQLLSYATTGVFPLPYQSNFSVETGYQDILKIHSVINTRNMSVELSIYEDNHYSLKVYTLNKLDLSNVLSVLENMVMNVMDNYSYMISSPTGERVWIHHFVLKTAQYTYLHIQEIKVKFEILFEKIISSEAENDYYNSLVLLAALDYREITLIRAWGHYLKQINFLYSQDYIQKSLANYAEFVSTLVILFHARFQYNSDETPEHEKARAEKTTRLLRKLDSIIEKVSNAADDQIVRAFFEVSNAILRTNFYLNNNYISFKISSKKISFLPLPRPHVEVFVYSMHFEAVHLRGGDVARGGIRWSDRTEDFRSEILGLMKAQMTKNVAIVPLGSKGGFVIKKYDTNDETNNVNKSYEVALSCYKQFLSGLLDITDNIINSEIVRPKSIVCYDGYDPYLVVAADKGTATFSDTANEISQQYNYWLMDAFASGGSVGYDHKKIAITSRGAWVSTILHFWEQGINIKTRTFTVVGIGDMSGDVFGNGMIFTDKIKLIAAFNNKYIFIDPTPDPEVSYAERARLFNNPRHEANWDSYNQELISKGGGIFSVFDKRITLTTEIKKALSINDYSESHIAPYQLQKYILKSKVDLLWNGGIGTFVKAQTESHSNIADKQNDLIRINGHEVRAKIISEGGNLGVTQLGRIEYTNNGGAINTDFIDNSAGVCCSDIEVNLKICLSTALESNKINMEQREKILLSMVEDVVQMILSSVNAEQSLVILREVHQSTRYLEQSQNLLIKLSREKVLDTKLEFLPDENEINKMHAEQRSFNRPQIAVIIAYAKMFYYDKMLASSLPDNEFLSKYLYHYFPKTMVNDFRDEILQHRLRREIISTIVINFIVNKLGANFINNLVENYGISEELVIKIIIVVCEIFSIRSLLKDEIDPIILDIPVAVYLDMENEISVFFNSTVVWFIRNYYQFNNIELTIDEFKTDVEVLKGNILDILDIESKEKYNDIHNRLIKHGISECLAQNISQLRVMSSVLSIIKVTNDLRYHVKIQIPVIDNGKIYFALGEILKLNWLRELMSTTDSGSYWQKLSFRVLSNDIHDKQMAFTAEVAKYLDGESNYKKAIDIWKKKNERDLLSYEVFVRDLNISEEFDLGKLVLVIRRLGIIIQNNV